MTNEKKEKVLVERPNKEQLKRESQQIKALVLQFIALPMSKLEKFSFSDSVRSAINSARTMTRTALKRQIKYIVGQLRPGNIELLKQELHALSLPHKKVVQEFHQLEQWRDALINADNALVKKLISRFPTIDIQHFRQIIRNAQKEKERGKTPKAARQLYQYLLTLEKNKEI